MPRLPSRLRDDGRSGVCAFSRGRSALSRLSTRRRKHVPETHPAHGRVALDRPAADPRHRADFPQQLPVALYKLSLISLAAVVAYWLDRSLFPYARPDSYLERDWRHGTDEPEGDADFRVVPGYVLPFCTAMLRRAIIVGAVVIGVALGL